MKKDRVKPSLRCLNSPWNPAKAALTSAERCKAGALGEPSVQSPEACNDASELHGILLEFWSAKARKRKVSILIVAKAHIDPRSCT